MRLSQSGRPESNLRAFCCPETGSWLRISFELRSTARAEARIWATPPLRAAHTLSRGPSAPEVPPTAGRQARPTPSRAAPQAWAVSVIQGDAFRRLAALVPLGAKTVSRSRFLQAPPYTATRLPSTPGHYRHGTRSSVQHMAWPPREPQPHGPRGRGSRGADGSSATIGEKSVAGQLATNTANSRAKRRRSRVRREICPPGTSTKADPVIASCIARASRRGAMWSRRP